MLYTGKKTASISFPLGGIGSGSIGMAGNGALIDFEIFGRPNKRGYNGCSGFAVRAEKDNKIIDARLLQSDYSPPYMGEYVREGQLHSGFGFGPAEETMAGMAHFEKSEFLGEFPIAEMNFEDKHFPANIKTRAWNPFIPLNDDDSSIPSAFFDIEFENTSNEELIYTACLFIGNPFPLKSSINKAFNQGNIQGVLLTAGDDELSLEKRGDISIATNGENASYQEYWYRGGWRDYIEMFWNDFTTPGKLKNRRYPKGSELLHAHKDTACISASIKLAKNEKKSIRFVISWSFPNIYNFWNPEENDKREYWKHYYAKLFKNSQNSAVYSLENWDRLYAGTSEFKEILHSSTLPEEVLDAVSSNLSVLKSPTCLRLENGEFYGFEGCISDIGCCEGSCTHVWNYAYALPFLFPKLERSMHDLEYKYSQREDGRTAFRLMLPLGRERLDFSACVDGQMGGVIKVYRDWKLSGDDEWLRKIWPSVKKCIEYAWADSNEDKWDSVQSGVLTGRQHHTLDMELYGPSSWLEGFYLAALEAAAEMAEHLGENDISQKYLEIFEKGKKWTDENLWNGEYFDQNIELEDKKILEKFENQSALGGNSILNAYWNDENNQIKYQIDKGCMIDQVIADWHTSICGLEPVFDKDKTKLALKSLYKNNFKSMSEFNNMWRNYALGDESGLVICTWSENTEKPKIPLTYATECMTGFEYQAACHMIINGLVDEGLSIVKAIRNRYDGEKRNPWNEIECGSNYARSMASYSLLIAFSGFVFDATKKFIGFYPIMQNQPFRSFWSNASAWGRVNIEKNQMILAVHYGAIALKEIGFDFAEKATKISINNKVQDFTIENGKIKLDEILLKTNDKLLIEFSV